MHPAGERLSRSIVSQQGMRDVFRRIGRRAEQFKRDVDAAAAENADYECRGCGPSQWDSNDNDCRGY